MLVSLIQPTGPIWRGLLKFRQAFWIASQQYVSIRDYGTVGLTGPIILMKLEITTSAICRNVYEISKPQRKLVLAVPGDWARHCLQVGIGLVLYYVVYGRFVL